MSLIENCDLLKNFATVFKICKKSEEKKKCIDMMKETYGVIQKICSTNTNDENINNNYHSMPAPLLLKIIKDSFNVDGIKRVQIVAPNVPTTNPTKHDRKFETSTRFQTLLKDTETESTRFGNYETESTVQEDETGTVGGLEEETQTETPMFTFMDKYGNKIASFFHDM